MRFPLRLYISLLPLFEFELLLLLSPFLLLCSSYDDEYVFLTLPLLMLFFSTNDPLDDDFFNPTGLDVKRFVKPCLPDTLFEL